MLINSPILRLTWTVIEESVAADLLVLSDMMLVRYLLQQVSQKILLSGEEVCALYSYLSANISLIRDIAESRLTQANRLKEAGFVAQQPCLFPSL